MIVNLIWGLRWPITKIRREGDTRPRQGGLTRQPSLLHWSKNDVTPNDRVLIALVGSRLLLKELLDATCPNKNRSSRPDECSVVSLPPLAEWVHRPVAVKISAPYFEILRTHHQTSIMTTSCLPPWLMWTTHTPFCLTAPTLQNKTIPLEAGSSSLLIISNKCTILLSLLASELQ